LPRPLITRHGHPGRHQIRCAHHLLFGS
jgi:hypothetical protein